MWRYIGWESYGYKVWRPYWSNVSDGGMDVAVGAPHDDGDNQWLNNTPTPEAEIYYGALEDYNGDIIAFCNDKGITRESI